MALSADLHFKQFDMRIQTEGHGPAIVTPRPFGPGLIKNGCDCMCFFGEVNLIAVGGPNAAPLFD